jgi:stalled ribosome rescue protein Dom34
MLVHSSNGYKHALEEILQDENVMSLLTETKYSKGSQYNYSKLRIEMYPRIF